MLHWCVLSKKYNTSKNLLITLALHLSVGGIFKSMSFLRAIIASMPSFLQYFFCCLGDQYSTAVAGDEAFQWTVDLGSGLMQLAT